MVVWVGERTACLLVVWSAAVLPRRCLCSRWLADDGCGAPVLSEQRTTIE